MALSRLLETFPTSSVGLRLKSRSLLGQVCIKHLGNSPAKKNTWNPKSHMEPVENRRNHENRGSNYVLKTKTVSPPEVLRL